jgi:hypothetical protein
MTRKALGALVSVVAAGTMAGLIPSITNAGASTHPTSATALDPANFVRVVDNPYFPLPVGRTWIYRGIKDGASQIDRVTVTARTKVIQGITATVVTDVATHHKRLLEETTDWYAQDRQGNVWYLGENTKAYRRDGTFDRSGSWLAGVHGAVPGIIMEANPRVPDAYRQEYRAGKAEDTAWIVNRGGTFTVPFGTVHHVLTSLEFTRLEPKVIDQKIYAPGVGIVREEALTGPPEIARLVRVIG